MRLLIIEDNIELANSMKLGLTQHGFSIDVCYDGESGEEMAFVNDYDAILLDLNLPDKDGIEILKYLRDENINCPVIIITARDEIEDRAFGLDLGADDYLTKPFELVELRARIQAVIRRYNGRTNPNIVIKILEINPATRIVKIKGKTVDLSAKEFDILEYIAEKHPTIISSEEIIEHIYDEDFNPFSSVLRVHIARLRKKLTEAAEYDILVTKRGKGYSLCIK